MNLHRSVLQAITLGCVLLTGCNFPQDYVDLMELPKTQRHETFRKLPIEKQVDFYLLRATFSHPPDTSFADDIALQGEKVIPYLLEQLKKEPVDHRRHYIIYVFERIHVNSVDLRENKEVIGALEQSVN